MIPGFEIIEELSRNELYALDRARRVSADDVVLVKTAQSDFNGPVVIL